MKKHWKMAFVALAATSLLAAACGDDGGTSSETSSTTTKAATGATGTGSSGTGSTGTGASGTTKKASVAGCEKGYTDPADLSLTRAVARCAAGSPAPVPLATKTTVKVATSFKAEFNSPIYVADVRGEFAKEGITIEWINLSYANSAPQLAQGQVDVTVGGFETALFNAGQQDQGIKTVLGNYYPPKAGDYKTPQTGLWCRKDATTDPNNPRAHLKDLETKKWASTVGKGSSAIYYSTAEILKVVPDFQIKKVDIQQIPQSGDIVTALKNKAIDCGVLVDPFWIQVKDDPQFFQAATQTPGEPLGQMSMGKSMLKDKPEVGQAWTRAYIRTINTYFAGDYHKDASMMADIQKFTGFTDAQMDSLKQTDSLTFDWEIRKDTTTRIQQLFIDLGVITNFTTPVAEDKIVDRSVYMAALGVK